ncbi:hypothetical protein HXX76_015272 [Chlamydomonas incerta]|uniref:Uncharacterized protein n=1 Tax=Chlamydomonas incerta TaxID=51695 RepID=A0A835VS52_CHLIN|nr:hypothetical protein HXX76_015272 [Chlamydomonas incerta]|eukprot:KAG2423524.1 hypothetical protein HXX76_015272 [Chlamydomonas incerta]
MEEQNFRLDQPTPLPQPQPSVCPAPSALSPSGSGPAAPAASAAAPAGPAWGELPSDALAVIINDCGLAQSDVAAVRLTCRHWRHTSCCWLQALSPACACLEQVADIAGRFPYLTSVDLTRCDTRLVGHACLCRDAASRLAALLAALAAMPSLTALTLSDTFSERMGQKYWAASVCAQALLGHGDGDSGAEPASASHQHQPQHQPPTPHHDFRASATAAGASVPAAMSPPATPPRAPQPAAAEGPAAPATSQAAGAASAAAGAGPGASAHADMPGSGPDAPGGGALSEPLQRQPRQQQQGQAPCPLAQAEDGHEAQAGQGHEPQDGQEEGQAEQEETDGQRQQCDQQHGHGDAPGSAPAAPATPGPATPQQVPAVSPAGAAGSDACTTPTTTAGAPAAAAATATGAAAAAVAGAAAPAPGAGPSDADLLLAELSDPGIKSFARAIARPGATHQHAFWLPDWFGPLASLREVAVRGRQRPAAGLPPCLLWLHVGRTAPQLTSLTLTRLGLATLPEQLQHLTALTRLVAQDCSLSLMPRGIAAGLSRLQHLDLSLNGLTSLPADFTCMTALQHLDLQRNKLAALPADLGRLSRLSCLLLCNNQLRQLPPSLSCLVAVQHLAASYNWLGGMSTSLPLLCGLPRLRRLELACVSDVRCRLVPPQELRLLAAHLTHLDLAANNLVPAEVLGTLTSLRTLVLSDCGLLAVPPWVRRLAPCLAHLDLSTNSLSELPPWLPACGRLRFLSIAHNRLSLRVPPSVLEQMPQLRVVESE